MRLKTIFAVLLLLGTVWTQDEDAAADTEGGEDKEECEEAWEYLEFLKTNVKDKIESILQDKLFKPSNLIANTVSDALEGTLEIRDDVLNQLKGIRTGNVTICPEQGVKQEPFLAMLRMDVMTVLLKLIEEDAADFTAEKLQEIGTDLLKIRTKVNTEITRIIMLRERDTPIDTPGECDCGILGNLTTCLSDVVDASAPKDEDEEEGEEGEEGADEAPAEGGEGGDDAMSPVDAVTMCLMNVDSRIGDLYQGIFVQLAEEKREDLKKELDSLKEISTELNDVISKMIEINDPQSEDGMKKIKKIISRDVAGIRNNVQRQLKQCQAECPGECDSCGARKIDDLQNKLLEYKSIIEDLEDAEALETIRSDLMTYLQQANSEMTSLLEEKVNSENGTFLPECSMEELDVINKIKGPLWMMVNITIFGDEATLTEMIVALEQALIEMRNTYCDSNDLPPSIPQTDNTCDMDEIETAGSFIADIDTVLSENLFKPKDEDARRAANLGIISLKSRMEDRVRRLYSDNLQCGDEVETIKNIYMEQITNCMSIMMSPKFDLQNLSRAERVDCIKTLRTTIEERRGELLEKEIKRRITEQSNSEDSA